MFSRSFTSEPSDSKSNPRCLHDKRDSLPLYVTETVKQLSEFFMYQLPLLKANCKQANQVNQSVWRADQNYLKKCYFSLNYNFFLDSWSFSLFKTLTSCPSSRNFVYCNMTFQDSFRHASQTQTCIKCILEIKFVDHFVTETLVECFTL